MLAAFQHLHFAVYSICPGWDCFHPPATHFQLTVAAGTINGLIFYANIVAVNCLIFFPPNETTF